MSRSKTNAATTHKEPGQRQENTTTESQTPRGIPIAIQHLGCNMAQSEGRTGRGRGGGQSVEVQFPFKTTE